MGAPTRRHGRGADESARKGLLSVRLTTRGYRAVLRVSRPAWPDHR